MKRIFSFFAIVFLILAFGCNHETKDSGSQKPDPKKPDESEKKIVIKSVKVAEQTCAENAQIEIDGTEVEVIVEFEENYAGLEVKIGTATVTITGKNAKATIKGITEIPTKVIVEAKATGRTDKTFKFSLKKKLSEADYAPISVIKIDKEWYSTNKKLETLEKGEETLNIEGLSEVDVKITMPEIWYNEDVWTLTLDGKNIAKTDFKKSGYSIIVYNVEKKVDLIKNAVKELKIVFENTARFYKKEYKISIKHKVVNKIKSVKLIDPKNNRLVDSNTENNYRFDETNKYYKTKDKVIVKDRLEKATFLIMPQDDSILPQYAFSSTEVALSDITSWQAMSKESVTYTNDYGTSFTEDAYVIAEKVLKHGTEFLYIFLEKAGAKTYYVTEIEREKVSDNNTEKEKEEKIYQDESGNKVDDSSPIAKKGLIRILPKSPRATVALVTPEAKPFTQSADGYYECTIELSTRETTYSYKILAEDGSTNQVYKDANQKFIKSVVIKDFKFDYKKDGKSWERKNIDEVDGKYYLAFDKKEVIENKLYLFVSAYKGLEIDCPEFLNIQKEEVYSGTDYSFGLDVSSLVNAIDENKEYTAVLKLQNKSLGSLQLVAYLKDDIIESVSIGYTVAKQLPSHKYLCKAELDSTKPRKIEVSLYLLPNETPENTNRKIRILNGSEEKAVTINAKGKTRLEFVHDGFLIQDKQTITLTIEYYADKTTSSPTKTYTLEVQDI